MARRMVSPSTVQVAKRGARRLPHRREALALALGALGSVNRHAGVRTLNVEINGRSIALALIEGAAFGEDLEGNTTLDEVQPEK